MSELNIIQLGYSLEAYEIVQQALDLDYLNEIRSSEEYKQATRSNELQRIIEAKNPKRF